MKPRHCVGRVHLIGDFVATRDSAWGETRPDWSVQEEMTWERTLDKIEDPFVADAIGNDTNLQDWYHHIMWDPQIPGDQRMDYFDALNNYVLDVYDIDFSDVFDWDDWREWYDAA